MVYGQIVIVSPLYFFSGGGVAMNNWMNNCYGKCCRTIPNYHVGHVKAGSTMCVREFECQIETQVCSLVPTSPNSTRCVVRNYRFQTYGDSTKNNSTFNLISFDLISHSSVYEVFRVLPLSHPESIQYRRRLLVLNIFIVSPHPPMLNRTTHTISEAANSHHEIANKYIWILSA